jgi:putative ABC transport system substrate-binding protein
MSTSYAKTWTSRSATVQQSTKLELVVNLNAAKKIGISVPPAVLATADEVIE